MIPYLDCRAAQALLEPFVDGELSVHDQVALESHLRWCRVCATRVEDMQTIGASLRVMSCALRAVDGADESLASVESEVLTRIQTEREQFELMLEGDMGSHGVIIRASDALNNMASARGDVAVTATPASSRR
jgi:anti-sigma factor RsiW